MKRWIFWFAGLILPGLMISCLDEVKLPIRNEKPRLVVEGQISSDRPPYFVRLTYSTSFGYDDSPAGPVPAPNATVSISDQTGRRVVLIPDGRPGHYRTVDTSFVGRVGNRYTLSVNLPDGQRFVSRPETLPAVPPIDSVYGVLTKTDNLSAPFVYAFYVDARDPAGETNYYRWTARAYSSKISTGVPCSLGSTSFCYFRCWVPVASQEFALFSDNATNGNPIRRQLVIRSPVYALGPHFVEVKQYGLTREAYQFLQRFREQQSRVGSIFDPLPAPIIGNIVNADRTDEYALGYFQAVGVTTRRLQNYGREAERPDLRSFLTSLPVPFGDCRRVFASEGAFDFTIPPPGF